jgi:hypothetical protein
MNNNSILVHAFAFYGIFLILCGIISIVFIGIKAKTALFSGGTSGTIALLIAYLLSQGIESAKWGGLSLSSGLFIVFSWRTTKTLFKIFELIREPNDELKGKGIAFLIIGLMAIVTLFVLALQLIF